MVFQPPRAWKELELDDEGNFLQDAPPVRCPRCFRQTDLGGIEDIDVHRCAFCRSRTRYLWSDRRGIAVPEIRGRNPDWTDSSGKDFEDYDQSDSDSDCEELEFGCENGCIDPVFDAPARLFFDGLDWRCPICGER